MSKNSSTPPRPPSVADTKSIRIGNDSAPPEDDTGSETRPPDNETIAKLAALNPMDYDRERTEYAKRLGCRTATLDKLVQAARKDDEESGDLPFLAIEPWPDRVAPAQLLDLMVSVFLHFIVMRREQAVAAVLWAAFTWFIDVAKTAPLAIINAPERACGKSILLEAIGRFSCRALPVSNTTPAALFRSVEMWSPTLLIDEADTFMGKADELKGIVNAGHTPSSAFVLRVVGDDHQPRRFNTYCPKALAGIDLPKHLPDSTMSRAVVFNLRRKLPHEKVDRLRHADPRQFEEIAAKLARFSADYADQVRLARPALPDALSDRDQDNWEPLMAIAGCAGPEWLQRATEAALKLSGSNEGNTSIGNELLADVRQAFVHEQVGKITTKNLIHALCKDDDKRWSTYNHGKPLTPRQLANLLAPYGIKPKTVRFGNNTPKGYEISQFADVLARYLPPIEILPQPRIDPPDSSNEEDWDDSDLY